MAFELEGKVYKIGTETTGEGQKGMWRKIDFMIEYLDGQYPKKAGFLAWTDKVDVVKNFKIGDTVTVHFNVESREYNDKFFTDLRVWKIQVGAPAGNPSGNDTAVPESMSTSTLPAATQEDDLPF